VRKEGSCKAADLINVPAVVNSANAAHCQSGAKQPIVECGDCADEFRPGRRNQMDFDPPTVSQTSSGRLTSHFSAMEASKGS